MLNLIDINAETALQVFDVKVGNISLSKNLNKHLENLN